MKKYKTLFDRLKPKYKSKVLDFMEKYPNLGNELMEDLNKFYIINMRYGSVIELNRICILGTELSFTTTSHLFEEEE